MSTPTLNLLQYNVQKSQTCQDLLLANSRLQEVDLIVLQEPWRNPYQKTSTLTVFSAFYPLQDQVLGRTLVLINRRIQRSAITPVFWSKDLTSLEIRVQAKVFWVHNLYFTPTSQENYRVSVEALLDILAQALEKEGEHILLTDSNLHHLSWSKSSQLYSELATKFKELTDGQGLELAIASFTPTRARTLAEPPSSAIDLSFISISLLNFFISSQINLDFYTGLDYRPVQTILSLETPKKARTHQRNWRTLDLDQVKKEAKNLPSIPPLLNREEVDNYLENLDKALQELADKTTRLLRDSKYTVPWWNQEIKEKIKKERKLKRKVFQN